MKRETAKAGECHFNSVRKALSYPSEICDIDQRDCATGSSYPPCLDSVLENDGAGFNLTIGNAITQDEFNQKVSYSLAMIQPSPSALSRRCIWLSHEL